MQNSSQQTAMSNRRLRFRRVAQIALLLIAMASSAYIAAWYAQRHALAELSNQTGEQLQLRALALQRLIDRYRVLPAVLALDPQLHKALSEGTSAVDTDTLNRKLEQANGATHVSTLTLIDRHGVAVAASNWSEASSNVGLNYTFRPYFQRAMRNGSGTFYAIGVSTNVAGYFIAEALTDGSGQRIGVVVVKITLQALEQEWADSNDIILLSDQHGIVFLSNRKAWQYRPLHALSAQVSHEVASTRQYGNQSLTPLRFRIDERLANGARRVEFVHPSVSGELLWRSRKLPMQGWTIHLLRNTHPVAIAGRHAALILLGGWLPAILLGLFLQQRIRLAGVRQRIREELERLVAHYAGALRSEQDSLVEAALAATTQQPHRLEQLPQGVSVIDADLRLVAWNSRYAEIFDFPANLLQVGRPIEDLFRFNAQRGLLGPGDAHEAIQRRLDYLQHGGMHLYERERPDGSVLEIRGCPLPGGGFVTSYADITPYKNAARALRSLTTTLERRIEKSTRELRAAKAEAERANRNKTRYVAAAVHDLLQPLNAARLFSGALHKQLSEPEQHAVLERIEYALQALDSLLTSMLDLSRLEAGALEPKLDEFPLSPMLQALARQFGIIAQARGLRLSCVDTTLWVRSDAMLLRRVLQNFLSNALHYTSHGRVLFGCRRDHERVRIEVWDTGIGIAEDQRRAIFEEFSRLDSGVDRDEHSAGLGLSIVKRIAALLNHPVRLHSWPGHGSVFSISLPRAAARDSAIESGETVEPADESPLANRCIFCIEDDRDTLDGLASLLHSWSCRVVTASNVEQARHAMPTPPDLVILDYRLGDGFGPDLVPWLYRDWNAEPPVIVLTAQTDEATRARIRAAGLSFMAKPASPAQLRALMSRLLITSAAP